MNFYKDLNGAVHALESAEFESLLPEGCKRISADEAVALQNPPMQESDLVAEYEEKLDTHLDSVAQSCRYADRTRLALRAAYPNQHRALAVAFGTWMDNCNDLAKQCYLDVKDGKRAMPSLDEFIAMLPVFIEPKVE